ncbi:hypothetical protein Sjap_025401 [Stephania japonica]|uniref:Apple domain-containing protein n=1 Tax=Stephania japonica TaxID=461633 RepID=A0AAP0HJJ4_9MAGN
MKLPDTSNARVDMSLGIEECEMECRNNCSCNGYSSADGNGSGCLSWFGDLTDIKEFTDWGQDLFVRVDAIELENSMKHSKGSSSFTKKKLVLLCVLIAGGLLIFIFALCCFFKKAKRRATDRITRNKFLRDGETIVSDGRTYALGFFSPGISKLRCDFWRVLDSLGEHSGCLFGLYDGSPRLAGGILEKSSFVLTLTEDSGVAWISVCGEGIVSSLSYLNMVVSLNRPRLAGLVSAEPNRPLFFVGIELSENYRMYYARNQWLPPSADGNGSGCLSWFGDLTDVKEFTDWGQDLFVRVDAIELDDKMNPKISDFGMARIFGGDQSEGNTGRVVGT